MFYLHRWRADVPIIHAFNKCTTMWKLVAIFRQLTLHCKTYVSDIVRTKFNEVNTYNEEYIDELKISSKHFTMLQQY